MNIYTFNIVINYFPCPFSCNNAFLVRTRSNGYEKDLLHSLALNIDLFGDDESLKQQTNKVIYRLMRCYHCHQMILRPNLWPIVYPDYSSVFSCLIYILCVVFQKLFCDYCFLIPSTFGISIVFLRFSASHSPLCIGVWSCTKWRQLFFASDSFYFFKKMRMNGIRIGYHKEYTEKLLVPSQQMNKDFTLKYIRIHRSF